MTQIKTGYKVVHKFNEEKSRYEPCIAIVQYDESDILGHKTTVSNEYKKEYLLIDEVLVMNIVDTDMNSVEVDETYSLKVLHNVKYVIGRKTTKIDNSIGLYVFDNFDSAKGYVEFLLENSIFVKIFCDIDYYNAACNAMFKRL